MSYKFNDVIFNVVVNINPNYADIAFASVDSRGTPGNLNNFVLENCGYDLSNLERADLRKGYALLSKNGLTPIILIVTIGEGKSELLLAKNILESFKEYQELLNGKRIWFPLMGTGSAQISHLDSFKISMGAINASMEFLNDIRLLLSLPNKESADNLITEFHNIYEVREVSEKTIKDSELDFEEIPVDDSTNYFLVGHLWGQENDQMNRFIKDAIWEDGHLDDNASSINSVNLGDVLLIKSTFAQNRKSYLRIKAFGLVIGNPKNGRRLNVNWYVLDNHIDFEGLGKYRGTFTEIKRADLVEIYSQTVKEVPKIQQILKSLVLSSPNEFQIDSGATLFYGQEVGEEIKDYDIIILPKSSYGGVGNHGISTHILELLGIDKDSLNFSEKNLVDYRYATHIVNSGRLDRDFILIFIVTRDKSKHHIDFSAQFFSAIENFKKSEVGFDKVAERRHLKIFVPFLGTGQAGMDVDESFQYLIPGIKNIRGIDTPKTIRINYPRELDHESINIYNKFFLDEFELQPFKNTTVNYEKDIELEVGLNGQDKIPFHLDNVETIDRLNREPVAKSLARLINGEIFANEDLKHSFMIHLQGEWGSGKSTFLNLIKTHLESDNKKWVIVNFDSWQNQHISPPWWSFIDQVYRQAIERVNSFTETPGLWLREGARRIIWYSGWNKIMALVISIILFLLLISYGGAMIKIIAELPAADNIDNTTKGLTLEVFAKLIVSIGSIVGLVYSLSKFLSTPFLMKSSGEAKSFMLRASDPMNRIKKHYNKLIENINNEGYNVAIFIDDIDRCDRSYTISLLEGIQTLFKEKKVLFIVAGDKNWISTCFENNYKEFVDKVNKTNEKLGDLFLEKVFQLSIRMPNVSEKTKEKYWNHILGLGDKELETPNKSEITAEEREEVKQKVKNSYSTQEKTNQNMLNELEMTYQLSEEEVSDIAIEALDESTEDIRHLFSGHYSLINPNPRSVKRLANNYTMYRNTMIAERKDFNPNKLFRWLIIDDLYPALSKKLIKLEDSDEITKEIDKMTLDNEAALKLNKLLFDADNEHGGQLEITDIKDILGL